MPCFAHQMLGRATAMSDLSGHLVCKVRPGLPGRVPPMRVPHQVRGTCHTKIAQVRMVLCFGLSRRPKVLIICDYVGMVLYLNDQHGILRLQVATRLTAS